MGSRGSADPTHDGRDGLLPVRGFFPRRREFRLQASRPHTLPGCAASAIVPATSDRTPVQRSRRSSGFPAFLLSRFSLRPVFSSEPTRLCPGCRVPTFDRTRRARTARLRRRLLAGGIGDAGLTVLSGRCAAGRIGRHRRAGGRLVRATCVRGQVPAVLRKTGPIGPVGRVICRSRSRPLRRSQVVSFRRSGNVAR